MSCCSSLFHKLVEIYQDNVEGTHYIGYFDNDVDVCLLVSLNIKNFDGNTYSQCVLPMTYLYLTVLSGYLVMVTVTLIYTVGNVNPY